MKVRLHSNDESAAEATDKTIQALPGDGRLARNADGAIAFDDEGLATVEGGDVGFLTFALKAQGYVADVFA